MTDILLVKQNPVEVPESDKAAARRVLFGAIDGLGEKGKKQWRRFINGLFRLEPGEVVQIKTNKPRSGPFHRRHMKIEQEVFECQERFENFEQFRLWLKVGAGLVIWAPGPKGGVIPVPKSISYADMEDDEMREFHEACITFLRTPHALKTLWAHLTPAKREEMIEAIFMEFGE